jgi:hypothetical protein
MRGLRIGVAMIAAALPAAGMAECPAGGLALPAAYSAWATPQALSSATGLAGSDAANFATGEAIDAGLQPDGEVTYLTLPKGAGEAASFGGLASFEVTQAGIYRVALGDFAWVDVDRDGKPLAPAAFGHGPECPAVKKVVDYQLEPGRYVLEISGEKAPQLRLMVLPRPVDAPPLHE